MFSSSWFLFPLLKFIFLLLNSDFSKEMWKWSDSQSANLPQTIITWWCTLLSHPNQPHPQQQWMTDGKIEEVNQLLALIMAENAHFCWLVFNFHAAINRSRGKELCTKSRWRFTTLPPALYIKSVLKLFYFVAFYFVGVGRMLLVDLFLSILLEGV